jgi:hypothetical protein
MAIGVKTPKRRTPVTTGFITKLMMMPIRVHIRLRGASMAGQRNAVKMKANPTVKAHTRIGLLCSSGMNPIEKNATASITPNDRCELCFGS